MPLLLKAQSVYVLTIENFMVDGPPGELLARNLRQHGVKAEAVTRPNARTPGEAVLDQTAKLGGDLLIKGAYTQSRLRQMIFGGATSAHPVEGAIAGLHGQLTAHATAHLVRRIRCAVAD